MVSEKVREVEVPGKNGYMGILPGHAPLISELMEGIVKYSSGEVKVTGGFVEVRGDKVRVLADAISVTK